MLRFSRIIGDLLHGPDEGGAQGLRGNSAAGLADGRQPLDCPFFRVGLLELFHQKIVRQHHQVHVPRLALATAKLTVSHAQLLFSVAVKSFCPCPTVTIGLKNSLDFQTSTVRYEHLGQRFIPTVVPNQDDPYRMFDLRQTDRGREVPLTIVATPQLLAVLTRYRRSEVSNANALAADFELAIGLEVSDVGSRFARLVFVFMDVVEVLGTGKIAVKREIARNVALTNPVDQLAEQHAVVLERFASRFALLAFLEAAKLQRIVLTTRADIVDKQIIVGDLVPILGVVPKPADVLDSFAVVVNQYVVQGNELIKGVTNQRGQIKGVRLI